MIRDPEHLRDDLEKLDHQFEETFHRLNKMLDAVLQNNKIQVATHSKKTSVVSDVQIETENIHEQPSKLESPIKAQPEDPEPVEEVYQYDFKMEDSVAISVLDDPAFNQTRSEFNSPERSLENDSLTPSPQSSKNKVVVDLQSPEKRIIRISEGCPSAAATETSNKEIL